MAAIGKSPIRRKAPGNFNDLRGLGSPPELANIRPNRENTVVVNYLPVVSISKRNEATSHDDSSFKGQDMSVRPIPVVGTIPQSSISLQVGQANTSNCSTPPTRIHAAYDLDPRG